MGVSYENPDSRLATPDSRVTSSQRSAVFRRASPPGLGRNEGRGAIESRDLILYERPCDRPAGVFGAGFVHLKSRAAARVPIAKLVSISSRLHTSFAIDEDTSQANAAVWRYARKLTSGASSWHGVSLRAATRGWESHPTRDKVHALPSSLRGPPAAAGHSALRQTPLQMRPSPGDGMSIRAVCRAGISLASILSDMVNGNEALGGAVVCSAAPHPPLSRLRFACRERRRHRARLTRQGRTVFAPPPACGDPGEIPAGGRPYGGLGKDSYAGSPRCCTLSRSRVRMTRGAAAPRFSGSP